MSLSPSPLTHRRRDCLNLELSPKNVHGVSLDPKPDWSLDDLEAELKEIAAKYSTELLPENKRLPQSGTMFSCRDLFAVSDFGRSSKTFAMRAFDDSSDYSEEDFDLEDDYGNVSKHNNQSLLLETKLTSGVEATDDQLDFEVAANQLMPSTGVVEGSLFELERERTLRVQEEIRERTLSLESELKAETERSATALLHVEKEREEKWEMARRVDKQYQRKIAEARDSHLSAVQWDHQQRSQIEERRIRKEVAVEEARKREKEDREIRERQEKARAEAEHAKLKAESEAEAEKKAAAEAEKKAAAELERRESAEREKKAAEAEMKSKEQEMISSQTNISTGTLLGGVKVEVAENAGKLEVERVGKLNAIQEQCQQLRSDPHLSKELKTRERQIALKLRQITGTQEQVRIKATELLEIVTDHRFPNSILLTSFATKVVSQCETQTLNLNSIVFGLAQAIVLVASQVPVAMDLILAEFHKSCIFTVPKYITYSKNAFESEDSYHKAVGYREDNGKVETTHSYLTRMKACVALYAAIVQTNIPGIHNPHGLKEGWAWLARFLNALPPDRFTGAALETFLKIAGFRLFQAYPKPFTKILDLISKDFIAKLKSQNDPDSNQVINSIDTYLITQEFRKEPQGCTLAITDLSKNIRC
ncbi:mRNA export factor GLE1 isoform X1 [Cryptomeria japonica]|uniref:mRNA export factor GLE1 isoform X1 n=1 Tax=Cryptomeria japonica TaxID=3369 RepID=UPI0027DA29B8|nr:mRNA export factor GLE1 isoform X1 [Cryptomeria japonica]